MDKKLVIAIIMLVALIALVPLVFCGCDWVQTKTEEKVVIQKEIQYIERFVFIDDITDKNSLEDGLYILVDKKTKVQYIYVNKEFGRALTVLVDENGNPKLYEGELL